MFIHVCVRYTLNVQRVGGRVKQGHKIAVCGSRLDE